MSDLIEQELVDMFVATALHHGIDLGSADATEAFRSAATELRFPGHVESGDEGPPAEYAVHNYVVRALGTFAIQAGLDVADAARCQGAGRCLRLRIPGFETCHWHGASATADGEILATMRTQIGVG